MSKKSKKSKRAKKTDFNNMSYEEFLLKFSPQICIGITFVPHGYQIDMITDGKTVQSGCGDFAGNHEVGKLILDFSEKFGSMLKEFIKNK